MYNFVCPLVSLDAKATDSGFVDSLYFIVIVFTTVGYGDYVPNTTEGKIFTIFFAYLGVWIISSAIGELVESILSAQEEAVQNLIAAKKEAQENSAILVEPNEDLICGCQRPDWCVQPWSFSRSFHLA